MITFDRDNNRFTFRIVGVALHKERVLLHRAETEDFWSLPGGRCELLERSHDTLQREMLEELGVPVTVERLLWVVENFFEYDAHFCHELGFYYLMSIPEASPLFMRGDEFLGDEGGTPLLFKWHDLDALDSVVLYPTFLRQSLRSLPDSVEHVVHVDEK